MAPEKHTDTNTTFDWQAAKREILLKLDVLQEVRDAGLEVVDETPNRNGWVTVRAFGREDRNPSAGVNIANGPLLGLYNDFKTCSLSFWDLIAELTGRDWKEVLCDFAKKTGVSIPGIGTAPSSSRLHHFREHEWSNDNVNRNKLDIQRFVPPAEARLERGGKHLLGRIASALSQWVTNKPGVELSAAMKVMGLGVGRWPNSDTHGHRAVYFPAYAPTQDGTWRICGVQIYRLDGGPFAACGSLRERKVHTAAGSGNGLVIVATPEEVNAATDVWKAEGVPDAIALASRLPAGHIAVSTILGAKRFDARLASLYAGKRLHIAHDADEPGQEGAQTVAEVSHGIASNIFIANLPYDVTPAGGKDLRDFFAEGRELAELLDTETEYTAEMHRQRMSPHERARADFLEAASEGITRIEAIVERREPQDLFTQENIEFLRNLEEFDPIAFARLSAAFSETRGFSTRTINRAIRSLGNIGREEPRDNRPDPLDDNGGEAQQRDLLPVVRFSPDRPDQESYAKVTQVLGATEFFYHYDGQIRKIVDGRMLYVATSSDLAGALAEHARVMVGRTTRQGVVHEYSPVPSNYANAYLRSQFPRGLREITLFTNTPVFDEEWSVVQPGYNENCFVYYHGDEIQPCLKQPVFLHRMLEEFCFESDVSFVNFVGLLLDAFIANRFAGARPLATFNANRPSVGKTKLAHIASIIRSGRAPGVISYHPDEEEFEKQIATMVRAGYRSIVIDNAKLSGRNTEVSSGVLERSITDPVLNFRQLGSSSVIREPNCHLFLLTTNNAKLSRDLALRSCPIELHYKGDPNARRYKIADPVQFAHEHRTQIMSELLGMYSIWLASGKPTIRTTSRFGPWASLIGGVLKANDLNGFLSNLTGVLKRYDSLAMEVADLAAELVGRGPMTAKELLEVCDRARLFRSILGASGRPRSRSRQLSNVLSGFVDEVFQIDVPGVGSVEVTLKCEHCRSHNQQVYSFAPSNKVMEI
jgi:hypothetical protein